MDNIEYKDLLSWCEKISKEAYDYYKNNLEEKDFMVNFERLMMMESMDNTKGLGLDHMKSMPIIKRFYDHAMKYFTIGYLEGKKDKS